MCSARKKSLWVFLEPKFTTFKVELWAASHHAAFTAQMGRFKNEWWLRTQSTHHLPLMSVTPTRAPRTKWCCCLTTDWERASSSLYAFFIAMRTITHARLRTRVCVHWRSACVRWAFNHPAGKYISPTSVLFALGWTGGKKEAICWAGYYLPSKQALSQIGKLSLAALWTRAACTQEIVVRARSQILALFDIQIAMSLFFHHAVTGAGEYLRYANMNKVRAWCKNKKSHLGGKNPKRSLVWRNFVFNFKYNLYKKCWIFSILHFKKQSEHKEQFINNWYKCRLSLIYYLKLAHIVKEAYILNCSKCSALYYLLAFNDQTRLGNRRKLSPFFSILHCHWINVYFSFTQIKFPLGKEACSQCAKFPFHSMNFGHIFECENIIWLRARDSFPCRFISFAPHSPALSILCSTYLSSWEITRPTH